MSQINLEKMHIQEQLRLNRDRGANLTSQKMKLEQALNESKELKSTLEKGVSTLDRAEENMRRYFTIGGKSADNGEITRAKEEIRKIIKKITNEVIVSIKRELDKNEREHKEIQKTMNELEAKLRSL